MDVPSTPPRSGDHNRKKYESTELETLMNKKREEEVIEDVQRMVKPYVVITTILILVLFRTIIF